MTRKQEDQIDARSATHDRALRKKRGPMRFPVTTRPVKAGVPLDRISFEQRLKYGFELLSQGEGE